jgi:hypothetical protein
MSNIASPAEIIFEKRARSKVIERLRGSPRADVRELARLIEALPVQPRRTVQISDELAVKVQGCLGEWGLRNGVLVRASHDPPPGASLID